MDDVVLKIDKLSFAYGKKEVLHECSCLFNPGIYVVLGRNGVGKTTLFRCILKQTTIKENKIMLNNQDINKISIPDYAKLVSYVPQLTSISNTDISVRDYLVQGRTPYLKMFSAPDKNDYLLAAEYAKKLGVDGLMSNALNELSGGQLQMVLIARVLLQETPIILMDEPLSFLDYPNQQKIMNVIKEMNKKTVVLTSHNPNHALYLNANILLMKNGTFIAEGSSNDVLTKEILSNAYECEINVHDVGGTKIITL